MDFLKLYLALSITILILLLLTPITLLIARHSPVSAISKAFEDMFSSTSMPRSVVEVRSREGLTVITFRWPDLGSAINSFLLPLVVSITATILGVFYALLVYVYRVSRAFLVLPLLAYMPIPFVKVVAIQGLLDPDIGLLNRFLKLFGIAVRVEGLAAVALYQVLAFFPVPYILTLSNLSMLPREFVEGSYSLGATPRKTVFRVLLPLAKPAILTSLALAYILSLDDLEAPIVFEGYPDVRGLISYKAYTFFVSEVYRGFSERAIGYTLILLIVTAAIFALIAKHLATVFRSFGPALAKPLTVYRDGLGFGKAFLFSPLLLVLAVSLAPTALGLLYTVLNPVSLELSPSLSLLLEPSRIRASINSVLYTFAAASLAIVISLPLAYWGSRKRKLFRAIEVFSLLPLSVPGIVVAYAYIETFGSLAINPFNTPWLYIIASYTVRRLPYIYTAFKSSVMSIPIDYEEAGQSLGASPAKVLASIVAPLAISTSISGAVLTCISMATEVSTSITIGGLGSTQGWESLAPLTYIIYRDVTISSIMVVGVYTTLTLITIAIASAAVIAMLKTIQKTITA